MKIPVSRVSRFVTKLASRLLTNFRAPAESPQGEASLQTAAAMLGARRILGTKSPYPDTQKFFADEASVAIGGFTTKVLRLTGRPGRHKLRGQMLSARIRSSRLGDPRLPPKPAGLQVGRMWRSGNICCREFAGTGDYGEVRTDSARRLRGGF